MYIINLPYEVFKLEAADFLFYSYVKIEHVLCFYIRYGELITECMNHL